MISDLLLFLHSRNIPKLKSALLDQLEAFFNEDAEISYFLFTAKLFLLHSEIFVVIGNDIEKFITEANLIRILNISIGQYWQFVQTNDALAMIQNMLQKTSLNGLILFYETLIPFASDMEFVKSM